MSTNTDLAQIFGDMAAVLELIGANPFKINAHVRVSRILRDLPNDVADLATDTKQLTAIEGIGAGSAKKIIEYVETGAVAEYAELLEEIPAGLLEVLRVPGLGPKTVKLLWEEAGVEDIASLKKAIDSGALLGLPRMGEKTIQNIKESLQFAARSEDRVRLGDAMPVAERIVAGLAQRSDIGRIEYAGSLRRGQETIGDIDILATTTSPADLAEAFTTMEGVERVLVAGHKKCSVRLDRGMQVDLRIVPEEAFGAALMYFTGSKAHNVRLRERAVRKKLRLNEYGLFPDDGEETPPQDRGIAPLAAATEEDVYEALGVPWVPPELREDRGEMDGPPDGLLELGDIRAELHAHTIASDGRMTIEELVQEARSRGFHTIAVTDHSRASAQANGLSVERLREHVAAIREVNRKTKGITVLAGSEVDILADGHLDYEDDVLAELDIVVASPHTALKQDRAKATTRLLRAIEHPLVHILGHPTGRFVGRREGLDPDIAALVAAAAKHDTALEINANYRRLDLRDAHVRAAVDAGALIAIDTDAHRPIDFDNLRYGVLTGRRGWLTRDRCINTWTAAKLKKWLKR